MVPSFFDTPRLPARSGGQGPSAGAQSPGCRNQYECYYRYSREIMKTTVVAIPSSHRTVLNLPLASFRSLRSYTLVELGNGQVQKIRPSPTFLTSRRLHGPGHSSRPTRRAGPDRGGMGMRPLMGFNQVGIGWCTRGPTPNRSHAVRVPERRLPRFTNGSPVAAVAAESDRGNAQARRLRDRTFSSEVVPPCLIP